MCEIFKYCSSEVSNFCLFQQIVKINEELEKPALLVPSVDEIHQMEEASKAASEVTSAMMTQRLELEEKKRTVQMLQKALVCPVVLTFSVVSDIT
jgi:hypothetical protein